jgi:hypothetical protein
METKLTTQYDPFSSEITELRRIKPEVIATTPPSKVSRHRPFGPDANSDIPYTMH